MISLIFRTRSQILTWAEKAATSKKEWAYLNFIQKYLKHSPEASKLEIANAWKNERLNQVQVHENVSYDLEIDYVMSQKY